MTKALTKMRACKKVLFTGAPIGEQNKRLADLIAEAEKMGNLTSI